MNFKSFFSVLLLVFLTQFVFAQPSNDECFSAISLTPNSSCIPVTGTVSGATQSMPGCTGTADDDVWYSFVANQPTLSVQVTGSAGFNAVIQVFSGSCSSLFSMNCVNVSGNGGSESANLTGLVNGATYFIRVYHFGT
ncbi:MAG: hypothetical protein EP305_07295, partial [Bacteroidetes bacterium]